MKNTFDGLISRLHTAEERTSELEYMSIEISPNWKTKKKKKDGTEYPRTMGQLQRCNICLVGIPKEQKKYLK